MATPRLGRLKRPLLWGLGGVVLVWGFLSLSIFVAGEVVLARFLLQISPKTYLTGTNILILGLDAAPDVQRSDTMMIVHLGAHKTINVLSIPRDTRIELPGVGHTKINHAYAKGKAPLAVDAVSNLVGSPIHHYVVLKLAGVAAIVDELGGVSLTIKHPLHYVDHAGKLFIDLQAGQQTLNGDQALQYLRFRHDAKGDIGRIERQQAFLQAIKLRFSSIGTLVKLPTLIFKLYRYIETDMSVSQLIGLAFQLQSTMDSGRIDSQTLPGEAQDIGGASYWIADPEKSRVALQSLSSDRPTDEATPTDPTVKSVPVVQRSSEGEELKPDETAPAHGLKLELLLGMNAKQVSPELSRLLTRHGIRVLHTGLAGSDNYEQTMIVDWKGNVELVLGLARLLSIDPSQIIVYDRPEKPTDATLILGKDWPQIEARLRSQSRLN